ncbi:ribokinase [Streptomyces sp. NBC_01497]|uniref:ribokinase n=1 Tax=Streptomyces sp. NBC_01497 TaxID=2903885 RepID=UPI002E2F27D4|nr:ribokinase [Streptomyces sp. NBC_01497]
MARNGCVLVVGSVNRDVTVSTERFPAPGETVLGGPVVTGLGGKGANQAVAAVRAGATGRFLATVGDDSDGRELLRSLAAADVDTTLVEHVAQAPTGTALITVDAAGENQIVVVAGANTATGAARVRAASEAVRAADVVVAQGEIPVAAIEEIAAAGPRLFVLNLAPYVKVSLEVLTRVDVLVVNATEAGQILGSTTPSGADEALEAVRALAGIARNAVVTLGGDGAVLAGPAARGRTGARHIPVPCAVPVVDATGAGDAFVGVLAARLAAGDALDEAAASAVQAATATVRVRGAAPAYPDFAALLGTRTKTGAGRPGSDRPGPPRRAPRGAEAAGRGKRS